MFTEDSSEPLEALRLVFPLFTEDLSTTEVGMYVGLITEMSTADHKVEGTLRALWS